VRAVSRLLHHAAINARDIDASLRFYRDGLGLEVMMDEEFDGDWVTLFGARSERLRSVFLGDPAKPDAGVVELVAFDGGAAPSAPSANEPAPEPMEGFFLLSFYVGDVGEVLERLAALNLGGDVRRIELPVGVGMATVRDPDGVLVELVGR